MWLPHVCAPPYCLSSPPFLFIILEVWTLLAVTCAHNDLAEDHQRERRERDRHSHKSKSNKTFKTNKCQGIFRGGLWRTQRNQYCRKRMYCKSDNKGRINLKARKIFKQKIKQEKKTKKKNREMQRVAWGIYIWYTTHHNPHFIPIQILHSSYFMNACVREEWERGLRLYLSPFYSCFPTSPYFFPLSFAKVVYLSAVARPWNVLAYDRGVNLCEVSTERVRGKRVR